VLHLLVTIVVGGVVGWLASIVMKTNRQMGIIANVLVGIFGSLLGYWVFGLLGIGATSAIGRLFIAVLGAMILIGILKAMRVIK
jgi:uncharacterized membrane protein YeaQ/YmgE (transglycosylase-associated protein family)